MSIKFGSPLQQVCFTFFMASMLAGLICDYVWAYHLVPTGGKFPTPWSVFELSANISLVIACVATVLFSVPLMATSVLKSGSVRFAEFVVVGFLSAASHVIVFAAPSFFIGSSTFFFALVLTPLLSSAALIAMRKRSP